MIVCELIAQLQQLPPEMQVVLSVPAEGMFKFASIESIEQIEVEGIEGELIAISPFDLLTGGISNGDSALLN